MTLSQLGESFRQRRLIANLTQGEVAERSGVPRVRISQFETGALPELGAVKLLSLFEAIGLELIVRPAGHQRTLDDVIDETETDAGMNAEPASTRLRVRHPRKQASEVLTSVANPRNAEGIK